MCVLYYDMNHIIWLIKVVNILSEIYEQDEWYKIRKMTTTAMLMQFVSKYLDQLTNENMLNNSDAESLRQQIKHLSFMVSIGINRTLKM